MTHFHALYGSHNKVYSLGSKAKWIPSLEPLCLLLFRWLKTISEVNWRRFCLRVYCLRSKRSVKTLMTYSLCHGWGKGTQTPYSISFSNFHLYNNFRTSLQYNKCAFCRNYSYPAWIDLLLARNSIIKREFGL